MRDVFVCVSIRKKTENMNGSERSEGRGEASGKLNFFPKIVTTGD